MVMDNASEKSRAFMTHNGLKVRLNHDFCAEYIEEKNILPWYISIEAFDSLRSFLSIVCAIIMMFTHVNPIYAGAIILVMYFYGYLVSQSFSMMAILNMIYGFFYMLYSFLNKLFISYIALVVIAVITGEYWILLSFVATRIICFIILRFVNLAQSKYIFNKYGVYLGDVETTAVKLLQFYSDKNIKYKQWIKEYSAFMN